jgi:C4-dicarboxylate-binding protein DctP
MAGCWNLQGGNMNKYLIATAAALLLALNSLGANAAETTMRITLQLPMKSHLGQNLQMFKDEVEKTSNGAIAVEIYDSSQLYKDKEVPQAVGSGAIEAGVASLTRYVGDIPVVDVFDEPFLFDSEEKVRKAVAPGSAVRGPIDEAIRKTGSTVLWWQAYGGAIMLSKKAPVKTPADLKGKKVRVFSRTLGEFVKAAGGSPTVISGSEQYLAYQRGVVDIGMTGISTVKSRKLWEVMGTVTNINIADVEFVVVVNNTWWNRLSEANRAIIQAAALKAETSVRDDMDSIEADAYAAAKANGMTIYTPTADEMAQWKAVSQPVYNAFIAKTGDLGKSMLEAVRSY